MKILHSSDLHGDYKRLLKADVDFDLWLDTGDFFDNRGRLPATGYAIRPEVERSHQSKLAGWKRMGPRFAEWLNGRPMLSIPGNHDFISLANMLQLAGADAQTITPEGVEALGFRWAGFREVSYLSGEWVGETNDFTSLLDRAFEADPQVLVTHEPPSGLLSGEKAGIPALTSRLMYQPHRIQAHFFGHAHEEGGRSVEAADIRFFNGACSIRVHELEIG